jgi:hypothetical protein
MRLFRSWDDDIMGPDELHTVRYGVRMMITCSIMLHDGGVQCCSPLLIVTRCGRDFSTFSIFTSRVV